MKIKEEANTETTLFRKYRPSLWDEVLGQEHIVPVLRESIKRGTISNAYLFAGSRGTGKTSVARIFARELGASINDIYEMDAASQTGVDNIRELIEGSRTLPFESPYKVYIIDEVHMLSKSAFNAFLKVLEEPPKHVVFILATTEMDRVLDTIISRCQTFVFKKPKDSTLKKLAIDIAGKEGFSIDEASAEMVAFLGDGSYRDAHGILQKIISFSKDKKISIDEVLLVTGAPDRVLVNDFIKAISLLDGGSAFDVISKVSEKNIDMTLFLKLVLQKIRLINLLRMMPEKEEEYIHKIAEDDISFLKEVGVKGHIENLTSKTIVVLLEAYQNLSFSFMPEMVLELAVMKIINKEE